MWLIVLNEKNAFIYLFIHTQIYIYIYIEKITVYKGLRFINIVKQRIYITIMLCGTHIQEKQLI